MKILLDEGVPWPMHKFLQEHDCSAAPRVGWGGIKEAVIGQPQPAAA